MKLRDFIRNKEWAYRTILQGSGGELNEAAKIVLSDLRVFCRATQTPFSQDPYETARNVGRLEVFQRIMAFTEYDYSKLYDLEEEIIDE